jgi:hypothetical protein
MSKTRARIIAGNQQIKVTVPADVAQYFESQAARYGCTTSAAAAPVLCAMARGEIQRPPFAQQPGAADTGRPL